MIRRIILLCLFLGRAPSAQCQSNNFIDLSLSQLGQRGLSVSLQLYTDTLAGTRANATTANATAFQYFDLSAGLDLGHLSPRLSGTRAFTSLHVNGSHAAGFPGAYQTMAGIACPPGVHFVELWLEHNLGKTALFRLGKIDANPDFASVENATGFLNSAFSYDPTFITLPNYSSTNWGGELLLHGEHLRVNLAAFSPRDGTGPLLMQEVGIEWRSADWRGRVSLGAWQRTGRMPAFNSLNQSGANGAYLVGEQRFWRHERRDGRLEQSLSGFFQFGTAPSAFSSFTRHIGGGVAWNAPLARRDHDSMGFAVTRGTFTANPSTGYNREHETIFETYYRLQLLKQVSVSPDFQYALDPGGVSSNRNTYALGARMIFTLSSKTE